ncbi:MAG: hypothetical protein ABI056_05055 [Caulobacteraceae bacterium]
MKTKFLKVTVLATAAIAVAALASPTMARTLKYTFGITGGGAYCDGLTITQNGVTWGGTHTGCDDDAQAGGISMKVSGNPTKYVYISTTDNPSATTVENFFLDTHAMLWYLYETSGGVYTELNSGPLLKGALPGPRGGRSSGSEHGKKMVAPF